MFGRCQLGNYLHRAPSKNSIASGGDVISAFAISDAAPFGAFYVSVPVPDPVVAAPLAVAFVFVPVSAQVAVIHFAAIFDLAPVDALVSAVLVCAAQVILAVSASSCFLS